MSSSWVFVSTKHNYDKKYADLIWKQSIEKSLIGLNTYPYCPHHLLFLIFLNILFAKIKMQEDNICMSSNLHIHALYDFSNDVLTCMYFNFVQVNYLSLSVLFRIITSFYHFLWNANKYITNIWVYNWTRGPWATSLTWATRHNKISSI